MNDELFQDILETTLGGELPINGEIVVETEDGPVTLDEADMIEDAAIEALENAVIEAITAHPHHQMRDELRALDEALSEGDYENAAVIGLHILSECGFDEARIAEVKKGMKFSAGQRAQMARARKKSKTGAQRMMLRKRRMAARKSSARMKRKAYYKRNRVRLAKRRAQLAGSMEMESANESFVLPTALVAQKLDEGMMFVVLADGYEPYFTETQDEAAEIADTVEGASIHTIDIDVIEEAKRRAKKGKSAKKDEMPMDGAMMEKGCATEMDDEEDYSDDEEDDEMAESLDESAAEDLAKEVASFIQQHPLVSYGELATYFKIGRDVAQQAMIIAGKVAGAEGEEAGWMALAKEILWNRVQHSAGATPAMTMTMAQSDMRESRLSRADIAALHEVSSEAEALAKRLFAIVAPAEQEEIANYKKRPDWSKLKKTHPENWPKATWNHSGMYVRARKAVDHARKAYGDVLDVDSMYWRIVDAAISGDLGSFDDFWDEHGQELNLQKSESVEAKRKGGKMKPKPKMVPAKGNKAGAVKVAKAALPAAKLKGQAGAIPSVHAPASAGNDDATLEGTVESSNDETELVDVTTSITNQDRLLAVAEEHGVSQDAKLTIADGVITLSVPKAQADAINQALSV